MVLVWAVFALWAAGSLVILIRKGVFAPGPLERAPARASVLSFVHAAAIFLLYLGVGLFAVSLLGALMHRPAPTGAATVRSEDYPTLAALQAADNFARIVAAAGAVYLAARLVRGGTRGFGLGLRQLPAGILYGVGTFLLILPWLAILMGILSAISSWARHGQEMPVHPILKMLTESHPPGYFMVVLILAAAVVAPFVEEIFFRGLIQTILIRPRRASLEAGEDTPPPASHRWAAILITSVLFTAIHFQNGNYEHLPLLLVLAVSLGYLYERTGNLYAPMALHCCFNSLNLALTLAARGT